MNHLETLLKNSGYSFYFLVVDKYLDINLPNLPNFKSLYHENLKVKNSGYLLSQKEIQSQISSTLKSVVVPFKPSAKIEHLCNSNNWLNASNPAKINRLLEDKVKFYELCQQNKLPLIPSHISPFNHKSFIKAQKLFGPKIVVQTHFGWAGNSTHLVSDYSKSEKLIPQNTLVKFSPYLEGYSLLNNCCQTRFGLLQSPPALQYTGLEALTQNPFATVGRQWPSLAPPSLQDMLQKITSDFSEKILKPLNYKGFFGLDFLVSENKIYLLECNPRLTASFAFYTQIEIQNKLNPLFYYHLAEFINLDYKIDLTKEQARFYNKNIQGSEITLRNSSGITIKKHNTSKVLSPSYNPIIIDPSLIKKLST